MANRVIEWMMSRDTGISSKSIVAVMTGANLDKCPDLDAPHDPADLGRCLRLLEQFPEWKLRMGEMSKAGRRWEIAVACWHEISASMEAEVGIDWSKGRSAPITYELMKERGL